jgi:hypothetical protein
MGQRREEPKESAIQDGRRREDARRVGIRSQVTGHDQGILPVGPVHELVTSIRPHGFQNPGAFPVPIWQAGA